MATIKKTYREIATFSREARGYLQRREAKYRQDNPDSNGSVPHNKFVHAVNRMLKRAASALEHHDEQVQDLGIECASEDKDGNIAVDERGNFKFSKENLLKRNKKQRELFNSTTTIEPYYATELPKDLSEEDREVFVDFVIKDESKK